MATNTTSGIGVRRNFLTLGNRNFENVDGTVAYKATRGLLFLGSTYSIGSTLTFDVGGTSYSAAAREKLEELWNNQMIEPVS